MVGAAIATLDAAGRWRDGSTVLVLAADHGDMQLEHQMFYKMVPCACETACVWFVRARIAASPPPPPPQTTPLAACRCFSPRPHSRRWAQRP
jgi:hypothetical protein